MDLSIEQLLSKTSLKREDMIRLLSVKETRDVDLLQKAALKRLCQVCGDTVYFRGLIEFSNLCCCDCHYCGIRASNININRYSLSLDKIVDAACFCARKGYGSIVLQSGERRDAAFLDFVETAIRAIIDATRSDKQPNGVAITVCIGEQLKETYKRFFDAGAKRYLLRIETSSPELFSAIHPLTQSIESRIDCLKTLKKIGYQVGTGVMIGLPGQTIDSLADDICFFREMDVDMIGMGPYLPHHDTPLQKSCTGPNYSPAEAFKLALRMIAVTRLSMDDVNIAATTALQAIAHDGREQGLNHGANVIMPQVTPMEARASYLLYDGKPCIDESPDQCCACLTRRIEGLGRSIGWFCHGDAVHAKGDK